MDASAILNDNMITVIILVITSIIVYQIHCYTFWLSRGIRGPWPVPLFGNTLDKFFYIVPRREVDYVANYGLVCGLYEMMTPVLNVADPEVLRNILIKDFDQVMDRPVKSHNHLTSLMLNSMRGEAWHRGRITMSPMFSSGSMKQMIPMMRSCVDSLIQAVESKIESSKQKSIIIDTKHLFGCYTMDSICKSAFATETNAHVINGPGSFVYHAYKMLELPLKRLLPLYVLPVGLLNWFKYVPNDPTAFEFLENAIREMVRQTRGATATSPPSMKDHKDNNLLQQLINSVVSGGSGKEDKFLTEEEIVANAILFLFAGYDSTSSLMAFAAYSLAMNQEVQRKLGTEIKSFCETSMHEAEQGYDCMMHLPYLDAFLKETLRMYTPIVRYQREVSSKEYSIPSYGLTLKKGDLIRIPVYAIHHNPDFYPNPEIFDPERFMSHTRSTLTPYTHLAFGVGPRNCLGTRLALMTVKLAMVSLMQEFIFLPCHKTPSHLDLSASQITLKCKNIFVKIERIA